MFIIGYFDRSHIHKWHIIHTSLWYHYHWRRRSFWNVLITHNEKQHHKATVVKTRSFSQANIRVFKENLDAQNFQFINNIECPNTAYDEFMKIYSAIFNKSFPLHESRFLKRQPLLTSGLLTSSCTKAKLFAKKLNKPTFENIEKYKSVNNTFNTLKRKMKASYYRQILEEHKHDSKKCWSILKQAIGKLSNKSSPPLAKFS